MSDQNAADQVRHRGCDLRATVRTVFVDHAAALLNVSRRTVYYWIRDGKLKTMRTQNGTQRVLIVSIETRLQEERSQRIARRSSFPKCTVRVVDAANISTSDADNSGRDA